MSRSAACPVCGGACGGSVTADGVLAFCGHQPGFGHGMRGPCACGQTHDRRSPDRPMANGASPGKAVEPQYDCIRMSDVQRKPIRWLWPDKLAFGKLSLVAGDGDLGKSWAMLDVAARLSTGTPLPGESERPPKVNTLLLMGEDDPEDTIGPRLDAQRADSARVFLLNGVKRGATTAIMRLQRDIAVLEAAVRDKEAKLLVIDGLASYMSGADGINEVEVRSVLLPLAAVAQRTGVAVVAIMHRNKGQHSNPINAIAGSVAFGNVARCVLGVANDPQAPGRRVLVPIKGNIIRQEKGVGYRIQDYCLSWDNDAVTITKETIFLGQAPNGTHEAEPDDDGSKLGEAKQFLRAILDSHGGSCPMRKVMSEALSPEFGLKEITVRRAKKELGVDDRLVYDGDQRGWHWLWPDGGHHEAI